MLQAGRAVLLDTGINVGASTFRYADAFDLLAADGIKVTRGSIHKRIWSSQEAWQLDVIAEFIRRIEQQRERALSGVISAELAKWPIDTVDQRRQVLAEACRVGSLAFVDSIATHREQRTLGQIAAAWRASSDGLDEHTTIGHHLQKVQHHASDFSRRGISGLAHYLGLEAHPARHMEFSEAIRAFTACTTALAYSAAIRLPHDPGVSRTMPVRSPDGEVREWNAMGLGRWMIARGLFSPTGTPGPELRSTVYRSSQPDRHDDAAPETALDSAVKTAAETEADQPTPGGDDATRTAHRRPRSELRDLMIDAGCRLLAERGLAFDPPHLTYANAFHHLERTEGIKLHRSQVHGRIWDNQEHYRCDVVVSLLNETATPGSAEVDEMVRELSAPGQSVRVRALAESWIAASTEVSLRSADADARYDLLVAAQALAGPGVSTPPAIADAAAENLRRRTTHNHNRYRDVARRLNASISSEFDMDDDDAWHTLARTSSSLLEGMRVSQPVDPDLMAPFSIVDNDGAGQQRDPATLGLCLIVEQLMGIDDDRPESAAPESPF